MKWLLLLRLSLEPLLPGRAELRKWLLCLLTLALKTLLLRRNLLLLGRSLLLKTLLFCHTQLLTLLRRLRLLKLLLTGLSERLSGRSLQLTGLGLLLIRPLLSGASLTQLLTRAENLLVQAELCDQVGIRLASRLEVIGRLEICRRLLRLLIPLTRNRRVVACLTQRLLDLSNVGGTDVDGNTRSLYRFLLPLHVPGLSESLPLENIGGAERIDGIDGWCTRGSDSPSLLKST